MVRYDWASSKAGHLELSSPERLSREAAQDRSPGWSEAEPWVKTPRGGSPEGAQENTPHDSDDGAGFRAKNVMNLGKQPGTEILEGKIILG